MIDSCVVECCRPSPQRSIKTITGYVVLLRLSPIIKPLAHFIRKERQICHRVFLAVDTNFPTQTGNTEQDMKKILNYLFMLTEQLRYTLYNLSPDNFKPNELAGHYEIRGQV